MLRFRSVKPILTTGTKALALFAVDRPLLVFLKGIGELVGFCGESEKIGVFFLPRLRLNETVLDEGGGMPQLV